MERIRALLSPRARLLRDLERIAGLYESLASSLERHAEKCDYPNVKAGLIRLAELETAQASLLRGLLLEHDLYPRPVETSPHEGSNNWERLRSDLDLQVKLVRELHLQIPEWGALESTISERLRDFAAREEENIAELRDLTLKCDPQALD